MGTILLTFFHEWRSKAASSNRGRSRSRVSWPPLGNKISAGKLYWFPLYGCKKWKKCTVQTEHPAPPPNWKLTNSTPVIKCSNVRWGGKRRTFACFVHIRYSHWKCPLQRTVNSVRATHVLSFWIIPQKSAWWNEVKSLARTTKLFCWLTNIMAQKLYQESSQSEEIYPILRYPNSLWCSTQDNVAKYSEQQQL